MAKTIIATVSDPHSLALYDSETGSYEGIIYVTSGTIMGQPIISSKAINVSFQENGRLYMSTYELPSRSFVRKIVI